MFLPKGLGHPPASQPKPHFLPWGGGLTEFIAAYRWPKTPSSWSGECLWGPSLGSHSGTCAWRRRKGVDLKVPGDVTFEHFPCLAMSGWAAGSLQMTKGARRGGLASCIWKSRGTLGLYREQRVSWWSGEGFCIIINVFSLFFLLFKNLIIVTEPIVKNNKKAHFLEIHTYFGGPVTPKNPSS